MHELLAVAWIVGYYAAQTKGHKLVGVLCLLMAAHHIVPWLELW